MQVARRERRGNTRPPAAATTATTATTARITRHAAHPPFLLSTCKYGKCYVNLSCVLVGLACCAIARFGLRCDVSSAAVARQERHGNNEKLLAKQGFVPSYALLTLVLDELDEVRVQLIWAWHCDQVRLFFPSLLLSFSAD